jgi:hypothetical protein
LLVVRRENVSAFRHKMYAAEDNVLRLGMLVCVFGKLETIAAIIGVLDNLVALVMVAENDKTGAKHALRFDNPLSRFFRREGRVLWR